MANTLWRKEKKNRRERYTYLDRFIEIQNQVWIPHRNLGSLKPRLCDLEEHPNEQGLFRRVAYMACGAAIMTAPVYHWYHNLADPGIAFLAGTAVMEILGFIVFWQNVRLVVELGKAKRGKDRRGEEEADR